MVAHRSLVASGGGSSFFSLSMALRTIALGSPSFAARSNNTTGTPALARCAAICAPMTPAPRTAALRTRNRVSGIRLFMGPKKIAAAWLRRGGYAVSAQRSLGGVGQLEADNVHIAPVRAA